MRNYLQYTAYSSLLSTIVLMTSYVEQDLQATENDEGVMLIPYLFIVETPAVGHNMMITVLMIGEEGKK